MFTYNFLAYMRTTLGLNIEYWLVSLNGGRRGVAGRGKGEGGWGEGVGELLGAGLNRYLKKLFLPTEGEKRDEGTCGSNSVPYICSRQKGAKSRGPAGRGGAFLPRASIMSTFTRISYSLCST